MSLPHDVWNESACRLIFQWDLFRYFFCIPPGQHIFRTPQNTARTKEEIFIWVNLSKFSVKQTPHALPSLIFQGSHVNFIVAIYLLYNLTLFHINYIIVYNIIPWNELWSSSEIQLWDQLPEDLPQTRYWSESSLDASCIPMLYQQCRQTHCIHNLNQNNTLVNPS